MRNRFLLSAALLVAVSGCNKKAEGQSVAVVNGEEITASELNAEIANANIPPDADKNQATAQVLQGLIDRRLLAEQARKDGIDRTPEFISRERRTEQDLLIGMMAERQLSTSKLPTAAEISAFQTRNPQIFDKREVWKLSQIQYESPKAQAVRDQIAQTKTLEELAAVLTRNQIPFQRGNNQFATNVIPLEIYNRLVALPAGEPFIVPAGNRAVASVIVGREPAPLTGAPARTEAVNLIRRQNNTQTLQQRLKDLRSAAKIEYKEGFAPAKAPAAAK